VADQALQIQVLKEVKSKNVNPSTKWRAVKVHIEASGNSTASACHALGLPRSAN